MSNKKEISNETILKIALEIIDLFISHGHWFQTMFYFLNHVFSSSNEFAGREPDYIFSRKAGKKTGKIYVFSNIRVEDYLKYYGDYLSIAMDWSSIHYAIVDYTFHDKVQKILDPFGLYIEAGEHWNFSVYPID